MATTFLQGARPATSHAPNFQRTAARSKPDHSFASTLKAAQLKSAAVYPKSESADMESAESKRPSGQEASLFDANQELTAQSLAESTSRGVIGARGPLRRVEEGPSPQITNGNADVSSSESYEASTNSKLLTAERAAEEAESGLEPDVIFGFTPATNALGTRALRFGVTSPEGTDQEPTIPTGKDGRSISESSALENRAPLAGELVFQLALQSQANSAGTERLSDASDNGELGRLQFSKRLSAIAPAINQAGTTSEETTVFPQGTTAPKQETENASRPEPIAEARTILETPEIKQLRPPAPVLQQLSVVVQGTNQSVRLDVHQKLGSVRLAVHSDDAKLTEQLRESLPELMNRLDGQGIQARVTPGPGASENKIERYGSENRNRQRNRRAEPLERQEDY